MPVIHLISGNYLARYRGKWVELKGNYKNAMEAEDDAMKYFNVERRGVISVAVIPEYCESCDGYVKR